jgi:biopolymer transport protein ExbD
MRRFSQRNSLVTLNEINITPLLDIAFVLLLIFIITRPLLEQSMELKLPSVAELPKTVDEKNVRTIEINALGQLRFEGKPILVDQLEPVLVYAHRQDPELTIRIRGDEQAIWKHFAQIMSICMKNGIYRLTTATEPESR